MKRNIVSIVLFYGLLTSPKCLAQVFVARQCFNETGAEFKLFDKISSQEAAKVFCSTLAADSTLARISNKTEHDFVVSLLDGTGFVPWHGKI